MYNNWGEDLSDSIKAIKSIQYTVLPKLIKGDIISIEESKDEVILMLDKYSGIDYLRKNEIGIQGIASRVQWGNDWSTFTIRKERHSGAVTEYEKRMRQIKEGYFYPAFTLQAYFDNRTDNNLLSIAICRTVDLYDHLKKYNVTKRMSDNVFLAVKWADMINKGYEVKIHRNESSVNS